MQMNDFELERVNEDVEKAWALFGADKKKYWVVVQISVASRVAIGDWFGLSHGEDGIEKIAAALRGLGADAVVDTAIVEDAITISETKTLLRKAKLGGKLPLFTSRCTAWVAQAQTKYPQLEISALPSTMSVSSALMKEFYREETGKRVCVIAVEPCAAKKFEKGVDLVLTTAELVEILQETDVNLRLSRRESLDAPFGVGSGVGYVSAIGGGVCDGVARCLSENKSDVALRKFSYSGLYGNKKRREATISIDGKDWKFAVVCAGAVDGFIEEVLNGATYDFVEVLACDGGCVGGINQSLSIGVVEMERAVKLREQELRALEGKCAAKSADMCPSAVMLAKAWESLRDRDIEEEPLDFDNLFEIVEEPVVEEVEIEEEPVIEEVEIEEEPVVEEVEIEEEPVVEEVEIEEEPVVEEVEIEEEPVVEGETAAADACDIVEECEECDDNGDCDGCEECDDCEEEETEEELDEEGIPRQKGPKKLSRRDLRKLKRLKRNANK